MQEAQNSALIFCSGCGEAVSTYSVERDGVLESRCSCCGLTLESAMLKDELKELECIVIADDSELIQVMLKDALTENKAAKKIITCSNGAEFITKITQRFEQRLPVELVILDIQMPLMSGINAAVAMRSIETAYARENRRVPIIFFSVKKCDEMLQKAMEYCKPAQYVNKGVGSSKREMFNRVKNVITRLLS